jgi:hypothetical protein
MNEWTHVRQNELLYISGFRLKLFNGTWEYPTELSPVISNQNSPIITARLIRDGLNFAKKNHQQSGIDIPHLFTPNKSNTLSLKK